MGIISGGGGGVALPLTLGPLQIDAPGTLTGGLALDADGDFAYTSSRTSGAPFDVQLGGAGFTVRADGDVQLQGKGANSQWLQVLDTDGTHHILLKTDAGLEVYPSAGTPVTVKAAGGGTIFRVDQTGALHGKTGQALTFDL